MLAHRERLKRLGPCGFLALLLSACAARSSRTRESDAFFYLHQAVGFLEAYKGGHCSSGLEKAKGFLNEARAALARAPDSGLTPIADEVLILASSPENVQIVQVERVRERLHALAGAKEHEHRASWNKEFRSCRD